MSESDVAELFRRYGYFIHRRCLAYLRDEAAAEDALQETFVRALRASLTFRGQASPQTWLCRIADHLCLDILRRRKRSPFEKQAQQDEAAGAPANLANVDEPETLVTVQRLMSGLDEASRRLVALYYLDEFTQEEIAEEMGISRRTLGKRLRALREQARVFLGENFGEAKA